MIPLGSHLLLKSTSLFRFPQGGPMSALAPRTAATGSAPSPIAVNSQPLGEPDMSNCDVIRSWKDPSYRRALSHRERAGLPPLPVSLVSLEDEAPDPVGVFLQTSSCTCHIFGSAGH
jgi:mersacidin/lichenicidin family type 2 lantibiotic